MSPLLSRSQPAPAVKRGAIRRLGEHYQLRFEHELRHVPALVWKSIASPEGLATWFPADVEWDFRSGGRIKFVMGASVPDGMITAIDPPHTFSFLWGEEMLRFEILEWGLGSLLVFTHTLRKPDPAKYAAGWHVCLGNLASQINGTPAPRASSWQIAYELYTEDFG